MSTAFSDLPSTTTTHVSNADVLDVDFEPSDAWKEQLQVDIQLRLQAGVKKAREIQLSELKKAVITAKERKRLDIEYEAAMTSIKQLADVEYQLRLEEERNRLLCLAGQPMLRGWSDYLKAEPDSTFKQGGDKLPDYKDKGKVPLVNRVDRQFLRSSPSRSYTKTSRAWGSRSTLVTRHEEPLRSGGGKRSAGPSPTTLHTEQRERYHQDRPPNPTPYLAAREQQYPPHRREPINSARDREIPRPPLSQSPYGSENSDYAFPPSAPPQRPPPSRSPYNGDDREYTPIRAFASSPLHEPQDHHSPPSKLSHSGSYPTPPPSRMYNYHEYTSSPAPPNEHNHGRQRPDGARPPMLPTHVRLRPQTDDDSEKSKPAWRYWGRSPQCVYPPTPPRSIAYSRPPGSQNRPRSLPRRNKSRTHRPPLSGSHHLPNIDQETDPESDVEDDEQYYGDMDVLPQPRVEPVGDDGDKAKWTAQGNNNNDKRQRSDEESETSRKVAKRRLRQRPAREETRLDVEEQERQREEKWRQRTYDLRVKEEEVKRKEEEVARRAEEAIRKEREAQRKAEEARLEKEEAERKAEEARRMKEEAQRKAEEARVKGEEAQRKVEVARVKGEELTRMHSEAHTTGRPYSFPAMVSNRQLSYPHPSHFRIPSSAKSSITTSSARNEEDVALSSDTESSQAVPVDTRAHLLEMTAASNFRSQSKSLNQLEAESHLETATDMGTTEPEVASPAVSNMIPEHSQFFSGARNNRFFGGIYANVAGDMINITRERSGLQVSAANDDEDADTQSEGDSSLQSNPFSGDGLATGDAVFASLQAQWANATYSHNQFITAAPGPSTPAASTAASIELGTEETEKTKVLVEDVWDEDTVNNSESFPLGPWVNTDNAYYRFLFRY